MRFDELAAAGVPVLGIPCPSRRALRRTFDATLTLRRYIRQHRIQVVHAFDTSGIFLLPLARGLGVPALIFSHLIPRELASRRARRYLRWMENIVDAFVVNCETLRGQLIGDERIRAERIHLIYNGVDAAEFHGSPRNDDAARPLVIGTVAVLRPEKNIEILLEAFAAMRASHPNLRLLIAGSGSALARLQQVCQHLRLESCMTFVPSTARVAPILKTLDIFVVCSRSEGLPNAMIEAMASGCPVVASRVGGIPEVVGCEERGLLFDSGNVDDLERKLMALVTNPALRRTLGQRASEFVSRRFTIPSMVSRFEKLYSTVLQRKLVR